jgi:diaminohydroxyphosphoribosylaminopyrimidine deaminase/5-amino-6-(5-phosphoribosylamino)uracil reductase
MDEFYMKQALAIASFGEGRTSPNPLVGAVVVKDGRIVGQGWHRQAGTPHAEIHALNQAGDLARGSTLYVTLEPCNHYGRTGPCTEAIIKAGIIRTVVGMVDPNPKVAGAGLRRLREAGIEVVDGILANEAAKQNETFVKWVSTGMPFTILKTAMTLDGKIATCSGQSQWITGSEARQYVHTLRDRCDAILVGVGTVLADNPQLTTRLNSGGKNPVRVIVDSSARTPLTASVVTDGLAPTIIAVAPDAPSERRTELASSGIEIMEVERGAEGLNLRQLFKQLGQRQLTSVLIEGGAAINAAALTANLVDKLYWFVAPKIVGGKQAPGPVGGPGIDMLNNAVQLEGMHVEMIGADTMITAYVARREGRDVYRSCGRIGQG